ncbi:MAG: PTS sugar transporter subunit IIA [Victivallaceae bacterium]
MDLDLDELVTLLNVTEDKVKSWVESDSIPCYRMHGEYRFNQEEIENWIFNNKGVLSEERSSEELLENCYLKYGLYKSIYKGFVFSNIEAHDVSDIFRAVCDRMSENFSLDSQVLSEMLISREKMMSTGIGGGVAIPHARDFFLPIHYNIVVVVFLKNPIDFKSLDGKLVETLFFLFACDDRSHLNLLGKIAYLSSDESARSFFETKPSKETFLNFIKSWEGRLNQV